jgi:hypothetical protein
MMVLTLERELMLQNGLHDFFPWLMVDGGPPTPFWNPGVSIEVVLSGFDITT